MLGTVACVSGAKEGKQQPVGAQTGGLRAILMSDAVAAFTG